MKKILLGIIVTIFSLILVACSNDPSADAMTKLNNQLDRVDNIVSATSTNEVSAVSPMVSYDANAVRTSLQGFRAQAYSNMTREENLRQEVLSLNSYLKSTTNKKYNLSKKKINSIDRLCGNISSYVTKLNETRGAVKNDVNRILNSLTVKNYNIDSAETTYISLNNCMNERYAYLDNIYSNLLQVYTILGSTNVAIEGNNSSQENPSQPENVIPQIDTSLVEDKKDENENKGIKNIDTFTNTAREIKNNPANANYSNRLGNNFYNYPNNPYNNRFYGYNNPYIFNRINPNRNTDSFYPLNRNIDTYRMPIYNEGIGNVVAENPNQICENCEEINAAN